jgi:hypothetical protein
MLDALAPETSPVRSIQPRWPIALADRTGRSRWPIELADRTGQSNWPTELEHLARSEHQRQICSAIGSLARAQPVSLPIPNKGPQPARRTNQSQA